VQIASRETAVQTASQTVDEWTVGNVEYLDADVSGGVADQPRGRVCAWRNHSLVTCGIIPQLLACGGSVVEGI
jgi:hypothetical protein